MFTAGVVVQYLQIPKGSGLPDKVSSKAFLIYLEIKDSLLPSIEEFLPIENIHIARHKFTDEAALQVIDYMSAVVVADDLFDAYGVIAIDGQITGGHRSRHIRKVPGEIVAFARFRNGSDDGLAVSKGFGEEGYAIDDPGQLIAIDIEITIDIDITGRHCSRYALPTSEGIAFFLGRTLGSNSGTVSNDNRLVESVIQPIRQSVVVDGE